MAVEQLLRYLLENPSWTVLGFAACAGTYFLLSRIVGGARSRGNPFATDQRRPREVLVTNQEAKNAILKWSENIFFTFLICLFLLLCINLLSTRS